MPIKIEKAFILAAGMGSRLRPYTDKRPKPLVEINDKALIDHAIDHLAEAGIKEIVVNTHYMAAMLEAHLAERSEPTITISHEDELLDTGGGIKKALDVFGDQPFFCVSSDWLWTDNVAIELQKMQNRWQDEGMDLLLHLQPLSHMSLTSGSGDYDIDADGRLTRSLTQDGAYMWTSVRVLHPRLFRDTPDEAFSFLKLMDRAQDENRLFGLPSETYWHHISAAADLESVRAIFESEQKTA